MSKYTKILILLYIVFGIILLTPRIHGNDGIGYYVYLRSLFFDHDLDFTNEFAHYGNQYTIVGHSPITGQPVNGMPIGSSILWSPFFLIAHIFVLITNGLGISWSPDGYSTPYVVAICFASSLYGFIGLYLIYKMARRFFSEQSAFYSVLLFWLSSPLVFYMYLHPSMAHANSIFAISLFLYSWCRIYFDKKNSWLDWVVLGLSAGLMTIVRLQDILFLIIPILCIFAGVLHESPLRLLRNILISLIFFTIVFLPESLAWKAIFGSYFSGPESHDIGLKLHLLSPKIFSVLFSGRHGLITWNPVILFGLLGIFFLYRKDNILTLSLLLVFLAQLWLVGSWQQWWGAHSFGHRMFLTSAPLFIFGLCGLIDYLLSRNHKRIIYWIGGFLILWNFALMVQYATNLLDRDGTTPFLQVILNQFTAVPQILFNQLGKLFSTRIGL